MKILLFSQWCQPEPNFKGIPFAKALQARGHQVEFLTGFPNYPSGKLYPGYRIRPHQLEFIDGIKVHRVPLYPSHDQSGLKRAVNYLSFLLSSTLLGARYVQKPDIIYAYNLVTLGPAAFILRARYGCPVVMDIQDLWPDSVSDSGMIHNKLCLNALTHFCSSVYRGASHLVTLSPGMKRELVLRGVPASNISVIYNWCDEDHLRMVAKNTQLAESWALGDKFVIMYAGAMGALQGLNAIIEAARFLESKRPDIQIVFVGTGVEEKNLRHASEVLSNVTFLGLQPKEEMASVLSIADVLLVHLKDTPLFRITIPSKTQAYMCTGKPVLMGVLGDAADIIDAAEAGMIVEPENPQSIADAMIKYADMNPIQRFKLGSNGRAFYEKNMALSVGLDRFEKIFETLTASPGKAIKNNSLFSLPHKPMSPSF